MKNTIVNEIILKMQSALNARQVEELKKVLQYVLYNYEIHEKTCTNDIIMSNQNFIEFPVGHLS